MNYLENVEFEANQFLSAAGDDLYADDNIALGEQMYADAPVARETALPIIIVAENTGTATETAIELFDAVNRSFSANITLSGASNLVKLTSGVQGVSYSELIRSIYGGETYKVKKMRIECLSASSDAEKESAPSASLLYTARTSAGRKEIQPLYPEISVLQQVKNIRDVEFPMIINSYTSITIESLAASSKVSYKLYASKIESPSASLARGTTAKEFKTPNPNQINW